MSKITGKQLPPTAFRLHETQHQVDLAAVNALLAGELAAYRVKQFLPQDACQQIVDNFWNSTAKVPRYGYGEDGVEGYFLGASHIERTTLDYLENARAVEQDVADLYKNSTNPADAFRATLPNVRAAALNGIQAGNSKAVYWNSEGEFLLLPHEDWSQTRDPRQADFEIAQVNRVMAFNFYASVPQNGGQLKLWNIEPDLETRRNLGVEFSGYPYPAEGLDGYERIIVPVATGDICLINGNLIHAAMRGEMDARAKERLLITFFSGLNPQNQLLYWT